MEDLRCKPAGEVLRDCRPDLELQFSQIHNSSSSGMDQPDASKIPGDRTDAHTLPENSIFSGEYFKYNMKNKKRGCFVIFVQDQFDESLDADRRDGGFRDVVKMQIVAKRLGFEYIKVFHNCDENEIVHILKQLSRADHGHYDCFACAILSHGDSGDVIYARDQKMHLKDFLEPFSADSCPTLGAKPKLFFIQACRGKEKDKPAITYPQVQSDAAFDDDEEMGELPSEHDDDMVTSLQPVIIPSQADFMIAHATPPGYTAWRNDIVGSWFIEALFSCVNRYGQELDLMQIMTKVNSMLAGTKIRDASVMQISSVVNQLRAEVRFEPKTPEPSRTEPMVNNASLPQVCSDSWR